MTMRFDHIIKGSLLSERAYSLMSKNVYLFEVAVSSNKQQIKKAVEAVFGVNVLDVNTSILRGKTVRKTRSKKSGAMNVKLSNIKKAFVKIKDGQKIDVIATSK